MATKDNRDYQQNFQLLKDMFPRMPTKTSGEILAHGFLKGSGRVGRATRLDEKKRIELAVNAHIRHRFTDYDMYLKARRQFGNRRSSPRMEARQRIKEQIKSISNSWRQDANGAGIEACQDPIRAAVCPVKVDGEPKHTAKLSTTPRADQKQSDRSIGSRMTKLRGKQKTNAKISRKRKSRADSRALPAGVKFNS